MMEYERVEVTSRAQWRAWLRANHRQAQSIWLITHKKHTGERHVPYDAVVEEALCFGWIDSHIRSVDADRSMLLISPRKPGSVWSALNKRRVAALTASGAMTKAGLAKIDAAKADGSWSTLDAIESLESPPDLAALLAENAPARRAYESFSASSRKAILQWILSAKRDQTRAKRIAEVVRLAALGLRANFPESKGK